MDRIINELFKEMILLGEFDEAGKIIENLSMEHQLDVLIDLSYKDTSISFYTFIVNDLLKQETTWLHREAIALFVVSLSVFLGADAMGLYHSIKAAGLDPKDIGLKQLVLSYYNGVPEPLLSKEEAMHTVNELFILDPDNRNALDALKECIEGKRKGIALDKNDFYSLLYYGRFEEARDLVKNLTLDELFEQLRLINQKEKTITIYGYVVSLLIEHETAALHQLVSRVLVELLHTIEGAYISAYWHAKRALELDPKNLEYKLWLLKFYELPGQLLKKDKAISIAKEIVEVEADNAWALAALEDVKE